MVVGKIMFEEKKCRAQFYIILLTFYQCRVGAFGSLTVLSPYISAGVIWKSLGDTVLTKTSVFQLESLSLRGLTLRIFGIGLFLRNCPMPKANTLT